HRHRESRVSGAVRDGRVAPRRASRRRRGRGRLQRDPWCRAARVTTMDRADVDQWIRYHSEISYELTMQRTALESALIPVSAYSLLACIECYRRYPDMIEAIASARAPEELGREGARLATQIDPVHLWAVPNFPLVGRKVLTAAGMIDPADDARRLG